jgi:hypothetical protein
MVPVDIKALNYWIKKESNAYKFFKNCVGKTTVFSAIDVKGINSILWVMEGIGVRGADIHSLTLQEDGSISSGYQRGIGSISSSSLNWRYLLVRLLKR